jgi:hypothetical protein
VAKAFCLLPSVDEEAQYPKTARRAAQHQRQDHVAEVTTLIRAARARRACNGPGKRQPVWAGPAVLVSHATAIRVK